MNACPNSPDTFDRLRRQAEERLQGNPPQAAHSPDNMLELIHELNIHQAELEIQNEELKRAQQELSDLHRQYERLYEFAPCGYVTLDPHGTITRANIAAVNMVGVQKKRLLGSHFSQHLARPWQDAFLEASRNAGRTGEIQRVEMQLKSRSHSRQWVRADITADRDQRAAVIQWCIVLADISQEKAAETQIQELNQTLEQRVAERTVKLEQRARQIRQLAFDLNLTEDRERKYLAAILHDDFQQQAAYIKLELGRLARVAGTDMRQELNRLAQFTDDCIEKMRHLAYSLNPPALHRSGLLAALDVLAKDIQTQHGLAVTLRAKAVVEPLAHAIDSMMYRSVRELLLNVVKHAGVNKALVTVDSQDRQIRIEVSDEGKGFDDHAIRNGRDTAQGFGLFNIEDRMLFLGGTMTITTEPGKGTRIVLTVPTEINSPSAGDKPARTAKTKRSKRARQPS